MRHVPLPITITGHGEDEDGGMRVDLELHAEPGEVVCYTPDALRKLARAMLDAADRADAAALRGGA